MDNPISDRTIAGDCLAGRRRRREARPTRTMRALMGRLPPYCWHYGGAAHVRQLLIRQHINLPRPRFCQRRQTARQLVAHRLTCTWAPLDAEQVLRCRLHAPRTEASQTKPTTEGIECNRSAMKRPQKQ
uniref:Uncharacterized protein n=1 Tax=Plectus sambesii TaxID=2011161 RepID=A0A914W4D7_9BILA